MSKKFLGKVLATAALGGAALLIAPGIALADDGQGAEWPKAQDDKGGYSQCAEWGDEAKKDAHGKPGEESKMPEAAKADEHGKPGGGDAKECDAPKGWVDGGGAGTTTDLKLATAGGTLLGAASLGGLVLLRRRRTDGSLA